jgi:hypothetical protein
MSTLPSLPVEQYRALQRDPIVLPQPEEIFDFIVETLVAKRLATYADADPFRAHVPKGLFLLVPPKPDGDLLGVIHGRSFVRGCDLRDAIAAPPAPYLMIDVDDGRRGVGGPPVAEPGRSPFLLWEGIVHAAVFPMVFESHDLVFGGTEHGSGAMPTLCRNSGRFELRALFYTAGGYPRCGVPTCALRVGAPAPVFPLTDTSHCDLLL